MPEYPMSHLPPQNPNRDPHIQGAGHPRNTPTPVPYGRYNPTVGPAPVPGLGWNDPALTMVQRKRSANRKVSVAGGIIGLITMIIQMIFTTTFLALLIAHGEYDLPFGFYALFVVLVTPYIVGVAWVATFILALVACIRAHSRTPQAQPDGWVEAKMPTSALLAASIVAGLPTFIVCVVWPLMSLSGSALEPLLVFCALVEVLIAAGFIVLLRRSKALDPSVRVP
ncbi:hypothetical protein BKH15_00775 [Actinomyces oris]|uniref:Uncharacterized protein n=2 Tax=Actinomyces oris TaxID=544580 RepID=A0A1Q8XI66_9ACTO|nr:hypothetical protein BKH15_00775 [Actinomyces oris]